jgi:hypothetical protein
MLVIKSSTVSTREGLETLRRDALLSGDSGGVRFLFDLAFPFSYAGGAPANGAAINDVAENSNGSFQLAATQAVGFNGNGFDFSTLTTTTNTTYDENNVIAPASVWADIDAVQRFLWCMYVRIPSESDFNSSVTLYPIFASSSHADGYSSVADPLTVAQRYSASTKQVSFRRQTAVGAQSELTCAAAGHYGQVAQLAFWRNAAGVGGRIKSAGGTTTATNVSGSDNSADFSACQPRFGTVQPFTAYASEALHRTARNFRMYRGFIENLDTSGRNPVTVLDADYERTIARGVFS